MPVTFNHPNLTEYARVTIPISEGQFIPVVISPIDKFWHKAHKQSLEL